MLAVHIDGLVFLLLVGAAALMRFLSNKANRPGDDDESAPPRIDTPPPLPREQSQTDEERIRKFLEALGQPTSSRPPAPVKPRTAPPPLAQRPSLPEAERSARRRTLINPLPPLTTIPPEAPRRVTIPRPMPGPQGPKSAPAPSPDPIFEVQQEGPPTTPAATAPTVSELVEAFAAAARPIPIVGPKSDLLSLLKTPEGLRQAVIFREIFGPPRSLQPLES
jgi:hypothetical protein